MMDTLFTFSVIFVAALVQASTGFGFAIMSVPLLLLLYDAHYAVSLANLLSLVSAVSMLPKVRNSINRDILKRWFVGSLMGLPLGGFLFYFVAIAWLKILIAITIVVFTLMLILHVTLPLGSGRRIGAISGLMTSSIGMPGPPIVLYLASKNAEKGAFRATSIAYYCLVYPIGLLIQFFTGHFSTDLIYTGVLMIPAVFLGQAIGSIVHHKINHQWFVRITYALLLATAVNVLIQSI